MRRREDRLAAIRAAKAPLEAAQRGADDARGRQPGQDRNPKGGPPYKRSYGEPDEKAQSNFTDPESGIMKTSSEGFQQCYNAQVAVDGEHQLVVATDLTANASDQGGLPALLDEVAESFGEQPETVLADAGYSNPVSQACLRGLARVGELCSRRPVGADAEEYREHDERGRQSSSARSTRWQGKIST